MLEYHSQVPDYPDCDPMLMALVRVIALLGFSPIIHYHSTSPCRDLAVRRKFLGRLSLISLALFFAQPGSAVFHGLQELFTLEHQAQQP
jgi:hypothetical protein